MKENKKEVSIITTCPFCGKQEAVTFNLEDFVAWKNGELIQNAFPYLSNYERELIMTGVCRSCWEKMFEEEEEEEGPEQEENGYEDYEDYEDYDMGFDPYLGCYTDDC